MGFSAGTNSKFSDPELKLPGFAKLSDFTVQL